MRGNFFSVYGAFLLLSVLFCACGTSDKSSAPQAEEPKAEVEEAKAPSEESAPEPTGVKEPTTVTLWHSYRGEEKAALEEQVKLFNAGPSNVTIDAVPVPYDALVDKLEITIPNGHGPDLFIFAHNMIGHWAKLGLVAPLSQFAKKDTLQRFLPETVKALVYEKTLYGLPLAYKSLVLFYNKALVPEPPKTMQELEAIANTLNAKPGLAFETGKLYHHAPFLFGFGGQIFDESGAPALDGPQAQKALEYVHGLVKKGTTSQGLSSITVSALFNEGKTPFVFNGPWFRGEIDANMRYGVAPMPSISEVGPLKPFLGSEALFINAKSGKKEAAYEAIEYLTGDTAALARATKGKQTVANKATYEALQSDATLPVFRAQASASVLMPTTPAMQMVWSHYDTAIQKVLSGTATPQAALKDAQALVAKDTKKSQ